MSWMILLFLIFVLPMLLGNTTAEQDKEEFNKSVTNHLIHMIKKSKHHSDEEKSVLIKKIESRKENP